MLNRWKYEILILVHKAKWYYIEFFRAIVVLVLAALFLIGIISYTNYQ
jgi:hypothetical protein